MQKVKKGSKKTYSNKVVKPHKRKLKVNPVGLIIDALLSIALIGCSIYLIVTIFPLNLIPVTWIYLGIAFLLIICLLNLILGLIKMPTFIHVIQKIVIVLMCGCLIFATNTIQVVDNAIDEVIKLPTSYKEYVSVVTLRSSKITSIDQIASKYIGIQGSIDTQHMDFAIKNIKDKLGASYNGKYITYYQDYNKAVQALYDGKVNSIVVSEAYRELIEESNADFSVKTAIIDAFEIETPVIEIVKKIDVTTNTFTVLVSGIDTLGRASIKSNSDVNMLITINPLTKSIVMNSIPRDAYVPNACKNNAYDKLTHTGMSGIDCSIKTIENLFDIEVNYYAKITFSSVINLVNALGGIHVDVPMTFCEQNSNRQFGNKILYINKGPQTLNGEQALALARHRYTLKDGDLGRALNQQLVINAIIKKALNVDILGKVNDLIAVVGETVQTNLTKKEIYAFTQSAANDLSTPWMINNHVVKGTNAWGECVSVPGMELSVVKLSQDEVNRVKYVIKQAESDTDLSDFNFTLNDVDIVDVSEEIESNETNGATGGNYCHLK